MLAGGKTSLQDRRCIWREGGHTGPRRECGTGAERVPGMPPEAAGTLDPPAPQPEECEELVTTRKQPSHTETPYARLPAHRGPVKALRSPVAKKLVA